ncbi:MAG: RNA-binding protein [Ruminococcus sp.]|nr:RNA-binding protein [Ruminococcus sp.]
MKDRLSFLGRLSDQDKLLVSKVADMIDICENKYIRRFTFFLDEHQKALCEKVLASYCFTDFMFFGGYPEASRTVLGLFPQFEEPDPGEFPIKLLSFSYRKEDKLTHRDFLGSFMAQRIERDTVGDIIISEGNTVAAVYETVAFDIEGITKIGRVGVKVSQGEQGFELPQQKFDIIEGTVASVRLDSVVSLALRISREKAAALIKGSGIELNYNTIYSADTKVEQGDVFSARGYGKYRLEAIGAQTKKDRTHITVYKFV